jgi:ribokinase
MADVLPGARPGRAPAPVEIAVVGSANVDLSIPVDSLPAAGQTVLGGDVLRGSGGKGANQAVAAARLGRRVALIGRVGDDDAGIWLRQQLESNGLDLRGLLTTRGVPSGLAVIAVDALGENSIVVSSGANSRLTTDDLAGAGQLLAEAAVVLTQLEVPLEVVAGLRSHTGARLILNPAPVPRRAELDLDGFDVIVPNRGELAALVGADDAPDLPVVVDQARSVDVPVVVVTLGSQGAMVVFNEAPYGRPGNADVVTMPALPVAAVDTTAAGDSFCGALAVALVEGADVVQATAWAVRVAGATVTARGAQDALPYRAGVGSWDETGAP